MGQEKTITDTDFVTEELILTAGPYVDYRELEYVVDATRNGWNFHHSDYLEKLKESFCEILDVKYGFPTSSCTGALHLALKSLDVGPGDEVIVPELTWVATAAAVKYVGAKPVFVDVERDTWVMCPESLKNSITSKTRAIIPVHLYGQPVDMDEIMTIANQNQLHVIEDAAQSVGSKFKGKPTGSFGDYATFSFQGAKALAIGEGGFLIAGNEALENRAWYFNDHCRSQSRTLFNEGIGFKYKMSNVQAAIGLAQVEKVAEIVNKKRELFEQYSSYLTGFDEFSINIERKDSFNSFWMTNVVLNEKNNIQREELMKELKLKNIDTRPIFCPLSHMPMFERVDANANAKHIGYNGFSLPSGHMRLAEEVEYISKTLINLILKEKQSKNFYQPSGLIKNKNSFYNNLHLNANHDSQIIISDDLSLNITHLHQPELVIAFNGLNIDLNIYDFDFENMTSLLKINNVNLARTPLTLCLEKTLRLIQNLGLREVYIETFTEDTLLSDVLKELNCYEVQRIPCFKDSLGNNIELYLDYKKEVSLYKVIYKRILGD